MAAGKYEDSLGLSLPSAAEPFCDAWKRAEELLQGLPAVPMVCLRPAAAGDTLTPADGKNGECITSRHFNSYHAGMTVDLFGMLADLKGTAVGGD